MFNKYELTLIKDIIVQHYAAEYLKREIDGLNQETIKAQLAGLFNTLVKINVELLKTGA